MKIIHSINNHHIERDIDGKENIGFLLSNGLGGYAAFAKTSDSRYNGWFVSFGHKVYKIIDEVRLNTEAKIVKIKNDFYQAERSFNNGVSEKVFVPRHHDSLVYELDQEGSVEIVLDMRESYDARNFGRNYEIMEEDGLVIITYTKYKNWEEDKSEGKEYEIFLAIKADSDKIEKIGQWLPKHYGYDERRSSQPFNKHVYKALKITGKKIVFSASPDKERAKSESVFVFENTDGLKTNDKNHLNKIIGRLDIEDERTAISYAAAKNSLSGLMVQGGKKFGIYAGLPWFFQFWTSDESISLKSASEIDRGFAKKVLLRDIGYVREDGKTYDVLYAQLANQYSLNIDAAGWMFKRAMEMIGEGILTKEEIKDKIAAIIDSLRKNHTKDGLVYCEVGETWMDTFYAKDVRDGARIEIQALMLSMYSAAFEITNDEKYIAWEKELRENVRKNFWNGKMLADGLDDYTVRPNVFIAYYIYPDLLTQREWMVCFREALSHLWLDWGGLATIDKSSPLFYEEYTGEISESYHRGDSWYWINNLAALALWRLDRHEFKDYIDKILKAGSRELLWHGYAGHMSELSSAKEQRSEGAWAQAWSAAMYMELIEEIEDIYQDSLPFHTARIHQSAGKRTGAHAPKPKKSVKMEPLSVAKLLLAAIVFICFGTVFGVAAYVMRGRPAVDPKPQFSSAPKPTLTPATIPAGQKVSGISISDDRKSILDAASGKTIFTIDDAKNYLDDSGYAYDRKSFYETSAKYDGECFGDAALSNKKDRVVFSADCNPGIDPNPEPWIGVYNLTASDKMKFLAGESGSNFTWSPSDTSITYRAESGYATISYQEFKVMKAIDLATNKIAERKNKADANTLSWKTYTDKDYGYSFKYPEYFTNDILSVSIEDTDDESLPSKCPADDEADPMQLGGKKIIVNDVAFCEYIAGEGEAGHTVEYIADVTVRNNKLYTITYNMRFPQCENYGDSEDPENDPIVIDCNRSIEGASKTMGMILSSFKLPN